MLGILGQSGMPVQTTGILEAPAKGPAPKMKGMKRGECGNFAVIKKDGGDFCSTCGWGFVGKRNKAPIRSLKQLASQP